MSQPPAPDDPARWSGSPGQREPTRQFTPTGQQPQPGQYAQPGQFPPPVQYAPSGQYGQPAQYAPPGQYGQPAQYPQPGQYGQPGQPPQGGYPAAGGYGPPPGAPWVTTQGGPGGPPPRRSGNGMVIALVVGVLAVVGIGVALFFGLRDGTGGATSEAPTGQSSDGLPPPTGLGDDPAMDALAQDCFDGDMQACDDLFMQSPAGSEYEDYGDTCAGRQPDGGTFCTLAFPD